jgi:hypothetical protein
MNRERRETRERALPDSGDEFAAKNTKRRNGKADLERKGKL